MRTRLIVSLSCISIVIIWYQFPKSQNDRRQLHLQHDDLTHRAYVVYTDGDIEVWDSMRCKRLAAINCPKINGRTYEYSLSPDATLLAFIDRRLLRTEKSYILELWNIKKNEARFKVDLRSIHEIGKNYGDARVQWLDDQHLLLETVFQFNDFAPYRIVLSRFDVNKPMLPQHFAGRIGEVIRLSEKKDYALSMNRWGVSIEKEGYGIGGMGPTEQITFLDLSTMTKLRQISAEDVIGKPGAFLDAFWLPDGHTACLIASNHFVYALSMHDEEKPRALFDAKSLVLSSTIDTEELQLRTCSKDKTIRVFDLTQGKLINEFKDFAHAPTCLLKVSKSKLLVGTLHGDVVSLNHGEREIVHRGSGVPVRSIDTVFGSDDIIRFSFADKKTAVFSLSHNKVLWSVDQSDELRVIDNLVIHAAHGKPDVFEPLHKYRTGELQKK